MYFNFFKIIERTDTMLMQSACDPAELSDLVVYATDMLATVDALVQGCNLIDI